MAEAKGDIDGDKIDLGRRRARRVQRASRPAAPCPKQPCAMTVSSRWWGIGGEEPRAPATLRQLLAQLPALTWGAPLEMLSPTQWMEEKNLIEIGLRAGLLTFG
jgi:hypothetical protein